MFDIYVQNHFLKTPKGKPFQVPTLALAKAIEEEWEKDPSPHYKDKLITSLVATALDRVPFSRESYTKYIIDSVTQDTILFWVETPEVIFKEQENEWKPLINDINKSLGLSLQHTFQLSHQKLTLIEYQQVNAFLEKLSDLKLIGFSHLISLLESFSLAYLVLKEKRTPEEAWNLAHLHEQKQRDLWGRDKEAIEIEELKKKECLETARFLKLIG